MEKEKVDLLVKVLSEIITHRFEPISPKQMKSYCDIEKSSLTSTEYDRLKRERIIGSSDPEYSNVNREELDNISFFHDMDMIKLEIHKRKGAIKWIEIFFNLTDEDIK